MKRSRAAALFSAACIFGAFPATAEKGDKNWFMAQTEKAELMSVTATSELVEAQYDGKYLYPPINILDGTFSSSWCEAEKNGPGIGESVTVEFTGPVSFDEIQMVNGFAYRDYYMKNNRVKSFVLTQVAGEHFQQKEYTLADGIADYQSVRFALPQTARTLTLKISDIYKGTRYDDTCISDIRLLYKGKVIPFAGIERLKAAQEENSKQMLRISADKFEKDFFALFGNARTIYLKGDHGESGYIRRCGNMIADYHTGLGISILPVETRAEMAEKYKDPVFLEFFDPDSWEAAGGYAGYDYLCFVPGSYRSSQCELGNCRLIVTERVGYVTTKTAVIVKLDGTALFLNGVRYDVIPDGKVAELPFYYYY